MWVDRLSFGTFGIRNLIRMSIAIPICCRQDLKDLKYIPKWLLNPTDSYTESPGSSIFLTNNIEVKRGCLALRVWSGVSFFLMVANPDFQGYYTWHIVYQILTRLQRLSSFTSQTSEGFAKNELPTSSAIFQESFIRSIRSFQIFQGFSGL